MVHDVDFKIVCWFWVQWTTICVPGEEITDKTLKELEANGPMWRRCFSELAFD